MQESELQAIAKACRYSFIPNELGYCGARDFSKLFVSFINEPKEEKAEEVKNALRTFTSEQAYIELIAEHHSLPVFDARPIEAYWLGSELLEGISKDEIKNLINEKFRTLPESVRAKKIAGLPAKAFIHHSFHVLYIEFITQKLPAIVPNLDKCLIGWGKVKGEKKGKFEIKGIELFKEAGELKLVEKIKMIENPFSLSLKKGSLVSVHWDNAVEEITEKQMKSLKKYTLKNMELANSVR
ncbi:MAG: DUF6390 family protein [Candidatus Diapherotrites archaeon]|nr:DUF6390 family protein [Candidatus Diapherotrites archaeon]